MNSSASRHHCAQGGREPAGHHRVAAAREAAIKPPSVADGIPVWQKVGRSLGALTERITEKVQRQRGRIFNPKILVANIKPPKDKVPPPPNWARDVVEQFSRERVVGKDVSLPYFTMVILPGRKVRADGLGRDPPRLQVDRKTRRIGQKGSGGQLSRETVRKVMDWLRENNRLGPLNSLYRDPETREKKRDSNVYILFTKEETAEIGGWNPRPARLNARLSLSWAAPRYGTSWWALAG